MVDDDTSSSDAWTFERLLGEWRSLVGSEVVDVAVWERSLGVMAEEERVLRAQGRWARGRDDFMGILGMERAEIRHSRVIAWLLDPCGRHGLGVRVLEGLLRKTMASVELDALARALGEARSSCEVPIGGGRLDVVVEAPGLYLVIENKVDAPEADKQCEHYFVTVERPDRRFIFLAPDRRSLRTERADVRDAFAICTYAELADLVEQALDAGRADATGRGVVHDYLRTLRREFR